MGHVVLVDEFPEKGYGFQGPLVGCRRYFSPADAALVP
jgi:hypothetical protein